MKSQKAAAQDDIIKSHWVGGDKRPPYTTPQKQGQLSQPLMTMESRMEELNEHPTEQGINAYCGHSSPDEEQDPAYCLDKVFHCLCFIVISILSHMNRILFVGRGGVGGGMTRYEYRGSQERVIPKPGRKDIIMGGKRLKVSTQIIRLKGARGNNIRFRIWQVAGRWGSNTIPLYIQRVKIKVFV